MGHSLKHIQERTVIPFEGIERGQEARFSGSSELVNFFRNFIEGPIGILDDFNDVLFLIPFDAQAIRDVPDLIQGGQDNVVDRGPFNTERFLRLLKGPVKIF